MKHQLSKPKAGRKCSAQPRTSAAQLEAALKALNSLIECGHEYPDAHTKVALTRGVDGDALTAAYDAQGARPCGQWARAPS